ncbi:MAG: beta-ketoacyl-[acyl-carrier-protein] synthase family protein [Acidobacteria bacterium]|nr:beta-ketoacyl-[acyl-carrier-protein] synthase family protein [Acidobacteriota bacterium]
MKRPRVLVTGVGVVSALGPDTESAALAVREGRSGIRLFPREDLAIPAGTVDDDWITAGKPRNHDRTTRLALTATSEAAAQAGLTLGEPRPRAGCIIGTGLGGVETSEAAYARYYGERSSRIHPLSIPLSMYNAATSAVSAALGLTGPSFSTVSACTSGSHAIIQGASWIRSGLADLVVCGGSDAPLFPAVITAWKALRVLAPPRDDPSRACRPFSADREGLVLAEGAATVVLESEEHARERDATPMGEILGVAMTSDAGHLTDPTVTGPTRAMRIALDDAGLEPDAIGYINAHGTATRANDSNEAAAIAEVFGAPRDQPLVSSTKALHGHAMGAAGAIELVLSLRLVSEGHAPAAVHLTVPDPECELNFARPGVGPRTRAFMSNSFGFGGMNGVLVLKSEE